jgi:hypothetical protein
MEHTNDQPSDSGSANLLPHIREDWGTQWGVEVLVSLQEHLNAFVGHFWCLVGSSSRALSNVF